MLEVSKVIVSNHLKSLYVGMVRKRDGLFGVGWHTLDKASNSSRLGIGLDRLAKRLLGVLQNLFEFPQNHVSGQLRNTLKMV